jgi:hypothetical protein
MPTLPSKGGGNTNNELSELYESNDLKKGRDSRADRTTDSACDNPRFLPEGGAIQNML